MSVYGYTDCVDYCAQVDVCSIFFIVGCSSRRPVEACIIVSSSGYIGQQRRYAGPWNYVLNSGERGEIRAEGIGFKSYLSVGVVHDSTVRDQLFSVKGLASISSRVMDDPLESVTDVDFKVYPRRIEIVDDELFILRVLAGKDSICKE